MTENRTKLLSLLADARARGTPVPLPDFSPPLAEAYEVQRAFIRASNLPVMVWKIGLTSPPARAAFEAIEPVVGRLAASAIFNTGSQSQHIWPETYAEPEIVFELGEDLPPTGSPYTRETVIPAIKGVYAGIELAATRYDTSDLPLGLFIADNAMAYALVLGSRLSDTWEPRFADMAVDMVVDGADVESGSTQRVMGNPLDALVWIANWLCDHGESGLRREQLVSSGSCTGPVFVGAGNVITARFDGSDAARITLI